MPCLPYFNLADTGSLTLFCVLDGASLAVLTPTVVQMSSSLGLRERSPGRDRLLSPRRPIEGSQEHRAKLGGSLQGGSTIMAMVFMVTSHTDRENQIQMVTVKMKEYLP